MKIEALQEEKKVAPLVPPLGTPAAKPDLRCGPAPGATVAQGWQGAAGFSLAASSAWRCCRRALRAAAVCTFRLWRAPGQPAAALPDGVPGLCVHPPAFCTRWSGTLCCLGLVRLRIKGEAGRSRPASAPERLPRPFWRCWMSCWRRAARSWRSASSRRLRCSSVAWASRARRRASRRQSSTAKR